jgi:hypothetical protein
MKAEDTTLVINAHEVEGARLAFGTYGQGGHSGTDTTRLLNGKGYRSKTGKLFSNETIRDLLQNRTHLGYIRYTESSRVSAERAIVLQGVSKQETRPGFARLSLLSLPCSRIGSRLHPDRDWSGRS